MLMTLFSLNLKHKRATVTVSGTEPSFSFWKHFSRHIKQCSYYLDKNHQGLNLGSNASENHLYFEIGRYWFTEQLKIAFPCSLAFQTWVLRKYSVSVVGAEASDMGHTRGNAMLFLLWPSQLPSVMISYLLLLFSSIHHFCCSNFACLQDADRRTDYCHCFPPQQILLSVADCHLNPFSFSSVAQSCPTLCEPMNCSTPGLPVHHQLSEFTQTP